MLELTTKYDVEELQEDWSKCKDPAFDKLNDLLAIIRPIRHIYSKESPKAGDLMLLKGRIEDLKGLLNEGFEEVIDNAFITRWLRSKV